MCLDEIKASSDDTYITEEHVKFLVDKYRSYILTKTYKDVKKQISESNYQTLCLGLELYNPSDMDCVFPTYLRSKEKIPVLLQIGIPRVYPMDYFTGNITYITRDRFRFIGHNKYMRNIIYVTIGADNHLYFKSVNPQHKYLERVKFTGIFEDSSSASELELSKSECSDFDKQVAIEDSLVPMVIELVVKELTGIKYQQEDKINNANDPNITQSNYDPNRIPYRYPQTSTT